MGLDKEPKYVINATQVNIGHDNSTINAIQNDETYQMAPPITVSNIDVLRIINIYYENTNDIYHEITEDEIRLAINKIVRHSKESRYFLYNIILNSSINQYDINMLYATNNIEMCKENKEVELLILEKAKFIEENQFTDDIDFVEGEDGNSYNYRQNMHVKMNQGNWSYTYLGKVIYCVYLSVGKDNIKFFDFLVNNNISLLF